MKFKFAARLNPSAIFGLPEDGVVVYPARPGSFVGPSVHVSSGVIAGHGTLPLYREESEALRLSTSFGPLGIDIVDDFVEISIEAEKFEAAKATVNVYFERFVQHLSVQQRRLISFEWLFIEDEAQNLYPLPRVLQLYSFSSFNLSKLAADILEVEKYSDTEDARLKRSLAYFEHAQFLFENRMKFASPTSRHFRFLVAAAFLNLWKSATVIVGDPARRKDRYQRRYRDLGLDESFKDRLDELKTLRDDHDVAHYSLTENLDAVESAFGEAQTVVVQVIEAYRAKLLGVDTGETKSAPAGNAS